MSKQRHLQIAVALVLSALTALVGGWVPARAQRAASESCHTRSWVAGTVDLCAGRLVYRDYVYDDYGADTGDPNAPSTAPLSRPAGDRRYEGDLNSADIVDLTMWIANDRLHVRFELNALREPRSTTAAVAIDTDNDSATGGGAWRDLGVSSEGWDVLEVFDRGDPETNQIAGSLPLPDGTTWRVQAVAAETGGHVMNVAFRGPSEETAVGAWWEDKQAAALRDGDISDFGHVVDVADLRNGVTRPATTEPGFHQRVYTSRYTLRDGEGMSYDGVFGRHGDTGAVCEQEFHFFGRYQPYGIYVPDKPGPHGMQMALHGCSANHSSLVDQPGMQARFGEELNRVIVVPLGRGPFGYYSDVSERDVLDVIRDVNSAYDIDREKVFAGGYSMGGYGAYRLAALYPHRFAGMVNWVGFTGDCYNGSPIREYEKCRSGAVGNVIHYVRNLKSIPSALLYAGADELVHAHTWQRMSRRFAAVGGLYAFYKHPAADHFTFALADDWRKESAYTADLTRVRRPAHVSYRTRRFLGSEKYRIRHDRAYWVSRIRSRTGKMTDVDLRTAACGSPRPRFEEAMAEGPDPVPWIAELRTRTREENTAARALFNGSLRNVRSLRIDAEAVCLSGTSFKYRIRSDGAVRLRLSDGRVLRLAEGRNEGVLAR